MENVLELVKVFPHVVENYNSLVSYYWEVFDGITTLDDCVKATPAESITRNFRRLVANGMIQLPQHIQEIRKEKEREYRSEFAALV